MSINEKNQKVIKEMREMVLDCISNEYKLEERDCGKFAKLIIHNMEYATRCYTVENVGNLTIMASVKTGPLQMITVVFTPYYKSLPLLSADFMYMNEKRTFLVELYDLVERKELLYKQYMQKFIEAQTALSGLSDAILKACWYDTIRSVCTSKNAGPEDDEKIVSFFKENIKLFVEFEKSMEQLSVNERQKKKEITRKYSSQLVTEAGPATNVFKSALGVEDTKQFFDKVFFGIDEF